MGDRLTLLLPKVGFGALVVGAFLVPIASSPAFADPFVLPKAVVSWVTVLLAVVGAVAEAASGRRPPFGRLRILLPLGLLVAWTALATVLSPTPLVSLMGSYGRYDGLAALLTGAGLALAVVVFTAGRPGRLAAIPVALLAGAAIALAIVVAQGLGWAWTGWAVPWFGGNGVAGLGGNPNFSGALLALAVPFALGLRAHVGPRGARTALVVAALALAGGVVWTQSRGGILAVVAGVAAFAWLAPELLPRVVRWGATAALAVAIVTVAASSLSDVLPTAVPGDAPSVLDTSGLGQRQNVWAGTARIAAAHPIVGVGPDALALEFPYERSARADGWGLIDADEAHDVYLDRAATAGLPALGFYLWLVGTVAVVAWRGRRRVAVEHRWLLAAFGGAFAGYLLQGAFSIDMVPLAFVAWLCIGALVSLTDPAAGASASTDVSGHHPLPVPVLGLLLAVAAVGTVLAVRPLVADRHARIGLIDAERGRALVAYDQFARASGWLDHEPSYHQRQATALVAAAASPATDPELRQVLLDEALLASDQALDRAPGHVPFLLARADIELLAAEAAASTEDADAHVDAAFAILQRLEDEMRADDALHLRLGRAYEVRARIAPETAAAEDRRRADEQYVQATRYQPDQLAALEARARIAVDEGRFADAERLLADADELAPDDPKLDEAIDAVDRLIEERNGS